ncbi:hypothetical protein BS78_08G159000 [Paspalum vaginatum]|nr:hypothetical protein BS78_08G159000 [Paspalum vaginatum]
MAGATRTSPARSSDNEIGLLHAFEFLGIDNGSSTHWQQQRKKRGARAVDHHEWYKDHCYSLRGLVKYFCLRVVAIFLTQSCMN